MQRVDRIARLGWFATAMLAVVTASACASTQSGIVPVSTTTTTSAELATPDPVVDPYVARRPNAPKCGDDVLAVVPNIDFVPRSANIDRADLPDLDRWASCLNEKQMEHTTVVLTGGQSLSEPEGLYLVRAQHIRDALVGRGVDPSRIVIGATNAAREGGPFASNTGVRIEVTYVQTIRGFVPSDTGMRAVIH
ncbi:MAG: OmpA family [Myxococcales bacterium]|nr:OmpA family [Myxococcales bacterium]